MAGLLPPIRLNGTAIKKCGFPHLVGFLTTRLLVLSAKQSKQRHYNYTLFQLKNPRNFIRKNSQLFRHNRIVMEKFLNLTSCLKNSTFGVKKNWFSSSVFSLDIDHFRLDLNFLSQGMINLTLKWGSWVWLQQFLLLEIHLFGQSASGPRDRYLIINQFLF